MTREEAINEINKVFTSAYANYIVTALTEGATVSDIQHRWERAYEAGVKDGLEQKPCEDAVSRAEVLNLVRFNAFHVKSQIKAIENMPSVTPQEPNTWSLDDAREDFMYDVYNELDFLPTNDEANRIIDSFDMVTKGIKQEPRWIPVTERLPEEMFGCLVTVWDANPKTGEEFENILPEFAGYDGETWNGADGKPIAFEVVAWMPLPEPYKEDKE